MNGPVKVEKQTLESELTELRAKYVPRGITSAHPLVADRAKGSELWDVNGRRFVDFAGGIGVMNVGHGHPHVMEAVRAQLERVTHTSFQVVMYESYLRLAERLCEGVSSDPVADGVKVTMSFGVAASGQGETFDYESVFADADAALYEAKQSGRNQTRIAGRDRHPAMA